MNRLAQFLRELGYKLRSGGARHADEAFERGAAWNGAPGWCKSRYTGQHDEPEIWLPWQGYNGHRSPLHKLSNKAKASVYIFHPAPQYLTIPAAKLMARNWHQIVGQLDQFEEPIDPLSEFVVSWTPGGRNVGGTRQAMEIAESFQIPVFNLGSNGNPEEMIESMIESIKIYAMNVIKGG